MQFETAKKFSGKENNPAAKLSLQPIILRASNVKCQSKAASKVRHSIAFDTAKKSNFQSKIKENSQTPLKGQLE